MELAIKSYDAGSTPAHQIANLRACSSASRMLRGRQSWSLLSRLQAVWLGNPGDASRRDYERFSEKVMKREIIIKEAHRGLRYEGGVLTKVLGAGRYTIPRQIDLGFYRSPKVEVALVDVRERDLTIKGQEILTADKVAIRVSIIVQFRVSDPRAAMHEVANYEERLYTDVHFAP